jgi:hypothetical protein
MRQYSIYLLTALLAFFTPIIGLVICVAFAIIFDTVTGVFKSVRLNGWRSITSRGLSNVISKMVLYQGCLLLVFTMDNYLISELSKSFISTPFFATKITCVLLLFIETVSIKENIESALNLDIWALLKNTTSRAKQLKKDFDELNN